MPRIVTLLLAAVGNTRQIKILDEIRGLTGGMCSAKHTLALPSRMCAFTVCAVSTLQALHTVSPNMISSSLDLFKSEVLFIYPI